MSHPCGICMGPSTGVMCESCGRSYDRFAHDEASVQTAMEWAARRALRLAGSARVRHRGLVTIVVDADEIAMLHDRVSAGCEASEEQRWDDLLAKVERARDLLAEKEAR